MCSAKQRGGAAIILVSSISVFFEWMWGRSLLALAVGCRNGGWVCEPWRACCIAALELTPAREYVSCSNTFVPSYAEQDEDVETEYIIFARNAPMFSLVQLSRPLSALISLTSLLPKEPTSSSDHPRPLWRTRYTLQLYVTLAWRAE